MVRVVAELQTVTAFPPTADKTTVYVPFAAKVCTGDTSTDVV